MSYQHNKTPKELNEQLLIGIKKHLLIAQSTSETKAVRLQSLSNVAEVLEYVLQNMNEAVPLEELAIYYKFFKKLLTRITVAKIQIHQHPATFTDEIGFISMVLSLR